MSADVSRETKLAGASDDIRSRIDAFVDLLLAWTRRINLISHSDEAHLRTRHIEDSAQLSDFIPPGTQSAIDIGSGAGFPGLILSIVTNCHFELVESDARKAAFLREAIRVTSANAHVRQERVEHAVLAPARLVTARAVASLARQLELAQPVLAPNGICIFPKGRSAAAELTDARRQWHMRVDQHPSRTNSEATIFVLSEIKRAGA